VIRMDFAKRVLSVVLMLNLLTAACAGCAYASTSWGFGKTTTIEETVLVDENNVRITATDMEFSSSGVIISLLLENNSSENLEFLAGAVGYNVNSVNGYMVGSGYLNCDVEANSSATDTVNISYTELMLYGIPDIADINLGFRIADDDRNYFYTGPRQILTSRHPSHDYSKNYYQDAVRESTVYIANDAVVESYSFDSVFSQEGIKINSWGTMINRDNERSLVLEVVNESDSLVYAVTTNLSLNGLLVYDGSLSSETITPGSTVVMTIPAERFLDATKKEVLGISQVSTIGLEFMVLDENYRYKIIENTELVFPTPQPGFSYDVSGVEIYNSEKLRIVYKAFAEGSSEYDNNLYAFFLIENKYGEQIIIRERDEMLNGNGVTANMGRSTIPADKSAFSELQFYSYSFEDYGIIAASDVKTINVKFEVNNAKYKKLDEIEITINTADGAVSVHDPWHCTACGYKCNGGSNCTDCGQARSILKACESCKIKYVSCDKTNYCMECGSALN